MKRHFTRKPVLASEKTSVVRSQSTTSGFSFDFIWDDDYDAKEIESAIYSVFEDMCQLEVMGIDFRSVDYEDVNEFAGQNISQCGVDFAWSESYNEEEIITFMNESMMDIGYEMIGYDFYSIG